MSSLVSLLAAHQPFDQQERDDLAKMQGYAASLDQPFSRAQQPAHFTGSAVVVDPSGQRVVLILHGRLKRWLQPGGHSEPVDEGDLARTALREAREETGLEVTLLSPNPLDIDAHLIPEKKGEPAHHHLDVRFLMSAENPDALQFDPNESSGAKWLSFDEAIAAATEPAMRRMLEKARALTTSLRAE